MSAGARAAGNDTVRRLQAAVEDLERRVAALENAAAGAGAPDPTVAVAAPDPVPAPAAAPAGRPAAAATLGLAGRTLLALAGAFLLRALTEGGVLPPAAGFALGLAYALALTALADRAAGRDDRPGATVHGLTALLVGHPFVWETTAASALVAPVVGVAALAVLTAAVLAAAWRRRLRLLYWAGILAGLANVLALGYATGAELPAWWLLLALGAATVLFSYNRGWYLARWPVALAADAVILRLAVMTSNPGGGPVGARAVEILCLGLLATYMSLFGWRALVQGRGVRAFDVVQSLLAIAVGLGGAAHAARHGGGATALLGWAAFAMALAGYGVAFTVVRQRHGRGRAFFYFASLALLFLVVGSELVVSGGALAWVWIALGIAAAWLGGRYDRVTLRAHSAVYLGLAAAGTGLLAAATDALVAAPDRTWSGPGASALAALAVTGGCYALLVRSAPAGVGRARRVPRFLVAVLFLMGLESVAVGLLVRLAGDAPPAAAAATVAVVRSLVLAGSAALLAVLARRPRLAELGWLVYPLLAVGLAKLALEDLALGDPVALTISFTLFGTVLLAAPRLRRRGRQAAVS